MTPTFEEQILAERRAIVRRVRLIRFEQMLTDLRCSINDFPFRVDRTNLKNWRWFHCFEPVGNPRPPKVFEALPVFGCLRWPGGVSLMERRRWKRRRAVHAFRGSA